MTSIKKPAALALTLITVVSAIPMTSLAAHYNEWVEKDGKWYYYDYNGKKVKSNYAYDNATGNYYVLDKTGARVTAKGWYTLKQKNITYYGDKYYQTLKFYLKKGGAVTTGWKTLKDKEYYFYTTGEMAKSTSITKADGKYYVVGSDGAVIKKKGWVEAKYTSYSSFDGTKQKSVTWYYIKKTGEVYTGWKKIGKKKYYFYSNGVMAQRSVISEYIDGKNVYRAIAADGTLITKKGLHTVKYSSSYSSATFKSKTTSSFKVYVKKDGTLHYGLKTIKGKKYWFDPEMMRCNNKVVDGVRYYFGKTGACTRTEEVLGPK